MSVETIGIRIQYIREKHYKMSQQQFADMLNVSQKTVSGMENDEVSAKNLLKLESLGINRVWLETGKGDIYSKNISTEIKKVELCEEKKIINFLLEENNFLKEEIKFLRNLINNTPN